ncbi:MAG: hypothetical protein OK441_06755 [Thaumarchaeota archaeon]|nr:hypothetical protein [Nitrososphaerota archaeon]
MKRVHIGVLGPGLGGASRMTAVGRSLLEEGCPVISPALGWQRPHDVFKPMVSAFQSVELDIKW